jgi:hypothetical protein
MDQRDESFLDGENYITGSYISYIATCISDSKRILDWRSNLLSTLTQDS